MERVVVTGLGVISCIGTTVETFWESLTAGRSGIDRIRGFDPSPFASQVGGEVREFAFDAKLARRMDRFCQFAMAAAQQALQHAGLTPEGEGDGRPSPERMGVAVGSGIGGEPFLEQQHAKFLEKGPGRFHPLTVPIVIPNMAAANIAIQYKLEGPNLCISTACATGNHNIGYAFDLIRQGRADVMVAGGSEAVMTPFALDGYLQLRALTTAYNDTPATASRPFSAARDGFVLAEGCGVVVLESLRHATARGAEILAEVAGVGMSSDASHLTAPHPEGRGAMLAMRRALEDAALAPEAVDYISAHGTATPVGDQLEVRAVKQVFGDHARRLPVSSVKSMIGHSLGGAAGIEAVAAVLTLCHGMVPPTINLHPAEADPELDLDFVPNTAREMPVHTLLSNAFAFGGHNAVLALKRFA